MSAELRAPVAEIIAERVRLSAETAARKRASRAAFRAQRKQARDHGLAARHARKLGRQQAA